VVRARPALDPGVGRPQTSTMTGAELLTYGKWMLFFAVPLGLGFFELWRLRRLESSDD